MKEVFEQYADYHLWANQHLVNFILALPDSQQDKELPSSFPSLFKTLNHMTNVDIVWWQRLSNQEPVMPTTAAFTGTIDELASVLIKQDEVWNSWVHGANSDTFTDVITYSNSKGEQFNQPVYQLLMQLFNHGTYHRGQLVTMFHQLELSNIPPTDFIVWSRRKV